MFDDLFEEEFDEDEDFASPKQVGGGLKTPRENPDLLGNEAIEQSLLSLYNAGKLPHALIFAGPMGVGKATMAFRLARFLLKDGAGADYATNNLFGDDSSAPTSFHVDENNDVFRKVVSGGHPDLRFVERITDPKTGVQKGVLDVDTVREIAPFFRKTTSEGGWRVVIVDEADSMNRNSQNAILKILEEPPQKSILILVCNRLGAMLPTIRSRCRVFHFSPIQPENLLKLLERFAPDIMGNDLKLITALSDGSMGRAQNIIEEKGANTFATLIGFMEHWPHWEWSKIHPMADTLSRNDAEKNYHGFTTIFEWICQSILKAKATGMHNLPEMLRVEGIENLLNHYSLEQWIEICEKLNEHFIAIDKSNLDRHQGVIGAFAILG